MRKQIITNVTRLFLFLLLVLIIGCAQFQQEGQIEKIVKENPESYVRKAYAGVYVIKNNEGKCEVALVGRDSPAGLAGILAGDIIYSVNDVLIEKRIQLFDIYDQMHPKDFVNVKIIRNGGILNKRFQLKEKYFLHDFYVMNRILCNENPVRLAIVFGDISNLYLENTPKFDHWKIGMKSYLLGSLENKYLRVYKYEKNFSVVDRARTKKICDEFKLQMLGLASSDTQIELAKMLNATHLLVVDLSRFPKSASKCDDVNIRRLIEVESGKTLASIAIKVEKELETSSNYRPRVTSTNLRQDILNYIAIIAESAVLERKAIDSYSKISGKNYLDKKLYYTLRDIVIPNYTSFIKKIESINPDTAEISALHKTYIKGARLQLNGFKEMLLAHTAKDLSLLSEANVKLNEGSKIIESYSVQLNSFIKKFNIE